MRTTTTSALLASMLAVGCVPIGSEQPNRTQTKPDAGTSTTDTTCDTSNITSKSGDFDFTSTASLKGLPDSCWTLDGKLTVDSSVTSLAKLGDLRGVKDLVITNSGLTTIDTPSPLAVSGSVDIEMNTKLTDLSNLSLPSDAYLTAFTLSGNTALTSMGALNQVSSVIGAAAITNNTKLTDIDFSNAVRLEGGLTISGNTAATTLELTGLTSVTGGMTIQNNTALTNLGTWTALQFMHGALTIDTNPALTSLTGVITAGANGSVGTGIMIEGALAITNNAKLADVGQFDHLSWAESVNVSNNAALTYCTARSVGCCVVDSAPSNVQMASITDNATTNCGGASSWCYGLNNNRCHNEYTGYNGSIE